MHSFRCSDLEERNAWTEVGVSRQRGWFSTEGVGLDRGGVSRQRGLISEQRGEPYLDKREEPFVAILERDWRAAITFPHSV
jgi:hypothetical protein